MSARLERVAVGVGWGVGRVVVEGGGVFALSRELRQLARWHDGPPVLLLLDAEELAPPVTDEQRADLADAVVELWRARIDLVADPESPVACDLLGGTHTQVAPIREAHQPHTAGTAPAPAAHVRQVRAAGSFIRRERTRSALVGARASAPPAVVPAGTFSPGHEHA